MNSVEDQLAIALDALNAIRNPLGDMVAQLPEGHRLSDIAPSMARDGSYLQGLATNALHAIASDDHDLYWKSRKNTQFQPKSNPSCKRPGSRSQGHNPA